LTALESIVFGLFLEGEVRPKRFHNRPCFRQLALQSSREKEGKEEGREGTIIKNKSRRTPPPPPFPLLL
jgi:hypothetical protein